MNFFKSLIRFQKEFNQIIAAILTGLKNKTISEMSIMYIKLILGSEDIGFFKQLVYLEN